MGLVPLQGRTVSKGVFSRKLWAQKDFRVPSCCWVGLCSLLVGCLAWGIPALEPTGCWVGLGLGVIQEDSHQWVLLRTTTPSVFVHAVSHTTPHICRRLSNTNSLVWCSLLYEVTASSPESWSVQDHVCVLWQWNFCFPQCCGIPEIKPSKPDVLGAPPITAPLGWGAWCGA